MKKQKIVRTYTFSDADLVQKGKQKISFMRRDKAAFAPFGITETLITELETALIAFSQNVTDIEAKSNQMIATQAKKDKAEELRTAIRNIMKRVELVFGAGSARYKKFGTKALAKKTDSELFLTAKVVVLVSTIHLQKLTGVGVTTAMLNNIVVLYKDFEELLHEQEDKIWERYAQQENRIVEGNAIYTVLVKYTSVGITIWETTSAAKYNDYIIYDRAVVR